MYDGRDVYSDVMKEEWKVGRNIHEIMAALPDFIDQVKTMEDQAIEQKEVREAQNLLEFQEHESESILTEVFGNYILGDVYDLTNF